MTMEIIEETGIRYIRIPLLKQDENDIVGKDILSEYDYNILKSAKIPGLASLTKRITDGEAYLQISVRSYISLVEKIEDKALCKEDVYDFFKQLLMVYEDMQSYLLQENMICLEPEWIFYDKEKKALPCRKSPCPDRFPARLHEQSSRWSWCEYRSVHASSRCYTTEKHA